jgi:hypothetical protein
MTAGVPAAMTAGVPATMTAGVPATAMIAALSVVAATVMAVMTVTVVAAMMMVVMMVVMTILAPATARCVPAVTRTAAGTGSPVGWRGSRVSQWEPGDGETDLEGLAAQQSAAMGPLGAYRALSRAGRRGRRGRRLRSPGGRTCLPVSRVQLRIDRGPRNEEHGEGDEQRNGEGKDEPVTRACFRAS